MPENIAVQHSCGFLLKKLPKLISFVKMYLQEIVHTLLNPHTGDIDMLHQSFKTPGCFGC
jgi:hypothetical protein